MNGLGKAAWSLPGQACTCVESSCRFTPPPHMSSPQSYSAVTTFSSRAHVVILMCTLHRL